jgi:sirohydrochlorin ferrochelatase
MQAQSAYLLISHGSRDSRSQTALEQLAQLFAQALIQEGFTHPRVETGTLEFSEVALDLQIQQLGTALLKHGLFHLKILPLFLLPGNHVIIDIPTAVALARSQLVPDIQIQIQPYLGAHPHMSQMLRYRMGDRGNHPWILVSHGSQRPGSHHPVEALAAQLGMLPAYWAGRPDLIQRVQELVATHSTQIGVLPYFLFPGRITDAIIEQVNQLKLSFNQLSFICAPPLEATPEVAHLLLDLI